MRLCLEINTIRTVNICRDSSTFLENLSVMNEYVFSWLYSAFVDTKSFNIFFKRFSISTLTSGSTSVLGSFISNFKCSIFCLRWTEKSWLLEYRFVRIPVSKIHDLTYIASSPLISIASKNRSFWSVFSFILNQILWSSFWTDLSIKSETSSLYSEIAKN